MKHLINYFVQSDFLYRVMKSLFGFSYVFFVYRLVIQSSEYEYPTVAIFLEKN